LSRQLDSMIDGTFEIYGRRISFVEPSNFEELARAYETKNLIENYYYNLMSDDETKDTWLSVLQEQESYIAVYVNNLGEFDNTYLINNIVCFSKKAGMNLGDLEEVLGLSAGYISRTAKKDSKKRISIDVVWKIAKLFGVSLSNLVEGNLTLRNVELLYDFIEKLKRQTLADKIKWKSFNGCWDEPDERYIKMGLIEIKGEKTFYKSNILTPDCKLALCYDIYSYPNFQKGKNLTIISCQKNDIDLTKVFDFLLEWDDEGQSRWERMFCTSDDAFEGLKDRAEELVKVIEDTEFEPVLTKEHRNMIERFLQEKK